MGRNRTEDMIAFVGREAALYDHLNHNHYPPVGEFQEAAAEAIAACNAGEVETKILLPTGRETSAQSVVEGLHLEAFIEFEEDDL